MLIVYDMVSINQYFTIMMLKSLLILMFTIQIWSTSSVYRLSRLCL